MPVPLLAYFVTFCEQTEAVRRTSARTADVFAAASMMAAAPEPMKHSLLCSQAHSLISYALSVLWRHHKLHVFWRSSARVQDAGTTYLRPELDSAASARRAR